MHTQRGFGLPDVQYLVEYTKISVVDVHSLFVLRYHQNRAPRGFIAHVACCMYTLLSNALHACVNACTLQLRRTLMELPPHTAELLR